MKQNYCIKIPTLKSRLVFNIATSIIFMIVCNISYGNNTYMPPSNDDPYSATMLTSNTSCSVVSSTTLTATDTTNPIAAGCSGSADDDVWFSFVATSTNHTITVTDGSLTDSVIELFTGSCGRLFSKTCIYAL